MVAAPVMAMAAQTSFVRRYRLLEVSLGSEMATFHVAEEQRRDVISCCRKCKACEFRESTTLIVIRTALHKYFSKSESDSRHGSYYRSSNQSSSNSSSWYTRAFLFGFARDAPFCGRRAATALIDSVKKGELRPQLCKPAIKNETHSGLPVAAFYPWWATPPRLVSPA